MDTGRTRRPPDHVLVRHTWAPHSTSAEDVQEDTVHFPRHTTDVYDHIISVPPEEGVVGTIPPL